MAPESLNISPANERPRTLSSRRSAIQILAVAALLIGARLATDLTSAASYVYPELDFGQFWLAILVLLLAVVGAAILVVVRLFQRRFAEALVLFVALCVPFSFKDAFDRHYWKFRIHKSEYLETMKADTQPPPKYRVFDWGNRNTSLGGGVIFEAIVYDETDKIARWPQEQPERRSNQLPGNQWITAPPHPSCARRMQRLGDHFYYVSEEC